MTDLTPVPVGNDIQVNTTTTDLQRFSAVSALADGGFVVTWSSSGQDGSGWGIYGQRFDAAGTPLGAEFRVNSETASDQQLSSVTALANGGFLVTWDSLSQDGSDYGVYGQRYDTTGAAVGSEFRVNTATTSDQISSSATALSDGGFVVVWRSQDLDGSGLNIYGQRYDASGQVIGGEFRVNTFVSLSQDLPSTTALADGGFVVTWSSQLQDGSNYGIYAQRYDATSATAGVEFRVNTFTSSTQWGSSTTALADGGFVVTWSSAGQDGSGNGIFGQRFDAAGTPLGAEFRVNTATLNDQVHSSVTALADGGFVVTWSSLNQDGSGYGVYGQRYDAAGVAVGSEFAINQITGGNQIADSLYGSTTVATLADGRLVQTWTGEGVEEVFVRLIDVPAAAPPPTITSDGGGDTASIAIAENASTVTTVTATPGNVGETITYVIAGGADSGRFLIDGNTGLLEFVPAPNFEAPTDSNADNTYEVLVRATSSGGGIDTQLISVAVNDVNENPNAASDSLDAIQLQARGYNLNSSNGHWYRVEQGSQTGALTYEQTKALAASYGGYLATITDGAENAFIHGLIQGIQVNGSISDSFARQGAWIGGTDAAVEGTWVWDTGPEAGQKFWQAPGTTFIYASWNPVEPNNNGNEDFVFMGQNGNWYDFPGGNAVAGYVVETEIGRAGDGSVTNEDAPYSFDSALLLANDSDPDAGNVLTITGVSATSGSGASVTLNGTDIVYDPTGVAALQALAAGQVAADTFTYTVSDGQGGTSTAIVALTVTGVNDAPTANAGGPYEVTFGSSLTLNGTGSSDPEGGIVSTEWDLDQDGLYDDASGVNPTIDWSQLSALGWDVGSRLVTVRVTDGGGLSNVASANVVVEAANAPPAITSNGGGDTASVTIAENSTLVATVTATDADLPAQPLTTTITGGEDQALFEIRNGSEVHFIAAPDFEALPAEGATPGYQMTVQVSDGNGGTDTQILTVAVSNVSGTITGDETDNLLVGTDEEDVINGLGGNDGLFGLGGNDVLDPGTTTLDANGTGFELVAGGAGNDTLIAGASGSAHTIAAYHLDGGPNGVTVDLGSGTATDTFGDTDTLTGITFVIGTGLADTLTGGALDDILAPGGGVDAIDGGAGIDRLAYYYIAQFASDGFGFTTGVTVSHIGDNVGAVIDPTGAIDTFTGIEEIAGTRFADTFNGSAFDDIFIGGDGADAFNGGGGIDTVDFSSEVVGGGFNGVTVDLAAGTATGAYGETDSLSGIERVLGTSGTDTARFAGNRADYIVDSGPGGAITVNGAGTFEGFELFQFADVTLSAADVLNDAPSGTSGTVTTPEDTVYTFSAADFGFSDPDAGDTLQAVRIDTLPLNGELRLSGSTVTAGQVIAVGDIGNLTFSPASDAFDNGYASFTFSVSDGALFSAAPTTLTIDVMPVNDAPTAAPVDLGAIAEDSGARTITAAELLAAVSDVDGPATTITALSIQSGNGTLTQVDATTWGYTPALNDDTSVTFAYTASDGEFSASSTASLDITPVNDAPEFPSGTGIVTTAIGPNDEYGNGAVIQPDGRIVVGGSSWNGANYDFAVVRYNPGGSLDTSFGNGGIVTTDIGSRDDQAFTIALQSDGKLVLGGFSNNGANDDFALARYNTDGSLDTSFGSGGLVTTPLGLGGDQAYGVTLQPDGKIVLAGFTDIGGSNDFAIVRYNADGSIDTSFGAGGIVTTAVGPGSDEAYSVTVQPDGRIVLGGLEYNSSASDFAMARYNPDGSLDTSFGSSGIVTTSFGPNYDLASSVILQSDGKILLGGRSGLDFGVARYNTDGSLDTSFGSGGMVTTSVGGGYDYGFTLTTQPDGKILLSGNTNTGATSEDLVLVRFNTDGSLDSSFGSGGSVITAIGSGIDGGKSVTVQPDGKIVVSGYGYTSSGYDFAVVRYNADGSLDTTFGGVNTLNGSPTYTENGPAVILDNSVAIYDAELAASDNYDGASLTLSRNGGASAQDVYGASGALSALIEGDPLVVSGTTIGTVTQNSDGALILTFSSAATQSLVNAALSAITYASTSDNPPASVEITWTFSDGNAGAQGSGGPLSTTGSTTVHIAPVNDAPVIGSNGGGVSASIAVAENTTAVTTVSATDADAGAPLAYSIAGGADALLFEIDQATGVLSFLSAPDYEIPGDVGADNVYDVIVGVSDGSGGIDTQAIAVTVENADGIDRGLSSVEVADLDGDGNSDILGLHASELLVYRGAGDGTFELAGTYATNLTNSARLTLGDVDGDGTIDVVAGNFDPNGQVATLLGAGDGSFLAPIVSGTGNIYAQGLALSDLNLDGELDLLVTNGANFAGVSVLLGDGTGSFSSVGTLPTINDAFGIAVADLNGDVIPDFINSNAPFVGDIQVRIGLGDGTFVGAPSVGVSGYSSWVALHDVNLDGAFDILYVAASGGIGVALGNGDGTFNTATVYDAGNSATQFVVADMNLDGNPDIVYADFFNGSIAVLQGDGNGGFGSPIVVSSGATQPEFVAVGNFDNTGALDVVVTNVASNSASIILNPVNAVPLIAGTPLVSVLENALAVASVSATDPDNGDTLTFSIVQPDGSNAASADGELFQIDATTGTLSFITGPDFEAPADAGADNIYNVTVQVSDGNGGFDTMAIAVTVTDINGVTIIGTNAANTVNATTTVAGQPLPTGEEDVILGLGGVDQLSGLGGDDTIDGGAGSDVLNGDAGNDTVLYTMGSGADTVIGGSGTDTLVVTGLTGNDVLDVLFNGTSLTTVEGGTVTSVEHVTADLLAGTNRLSYAGAGTTSGVTVNLALGAASGFVAVANITDVTGGSLADSLTGDALANALNGGSGDDTLAGGLGADVLSGGAGIDTASYAGETDAMFVSLVDNTAHRGAAGAGVEDTLSGIENLVGGTGADQLTGRTGANLIDGGEGADTIAGGRGADALFGGLGDDTFIFSFGDGADVTNGGDGFDALSVAGTAGDDTLDVLYDGSAISTLEGGSLTSIEAVTAALDGGTDTLRYAGTSSAIVVDLSGGTASGFASVSGIENVLGGAGDDLLAGAAGVNNVLTGGAGNDQFTVHDTGDTVSEAANGGTDTVLSLASSFTISDADVENLTFIGSGNFAGTGNGRANAITGGNGADTLSGGGGNDTLVGGGGADTMNGGTGDDTFVFAEGFGNDVISGFDASPDAGGNQDLIDVRGFGIDAANFLSHVLIEDLGADTRVTIDGTGTILLVGVSGTGANIITASDFIL